VASTVADVIVATLRASGVQRVYGNPGDSLNGFTDALRRDGHDVRSDRYELSLPPKISYGELKGFTLYATRTILSGEGKELAELTKTNLRELDVE
jgi:pyruvate dehydrogenase (quinone)